MPIKSATTVLTVSEIVNQAKTLLEQSFGTVWIEGEISNLKQHASGHWYFTLKDRSSQLRCAMFRGANRQVRFQVEDGLQVRSFGRLSIYPGRGDFQMVVELMEPAGLGALQLAFEQLKQKLADEGLFSQDQKQALPAYPSRIAVVTSPTGAAIQDILNVIGRRSPLTTVDIYPVPVQGPKAAPAIARAIDRLNEAAGWDVIICGRGGGSLEDLWAFNEESVARAIARSHIPIISAVGHEVDYTIADFVADRRAETPTAAAELVVKDKQEIVAAFNHHEQQLHRIIRALLAKHRSQLEQISRSAVLKKPTGMLEPWVQRLDEATGRLKKTVHLLLQHKQSDLKLYMAQLHALSPLNVMARGYALVYQWPEKVLVKDSRQLSSNQEINIQLAKGSIRAKTI